MVWNGLNWHKMESTCGSLVSKSGEPSDHTERETSWLTGLLVKSVLQCVDLFSAWPWGYVQSNLNLTSQPFHYVFATRMACSSEVNSKLPWKVWWNFHDFITISEGYSEPAEDRKPNLAVVLSATSYSDSYLEIVASDCSWCIVVAGVCKHFLILH
jgi:hypothetical protein